MCQGMCISAAITCAGPIRAYETCRLCCRCCLKSPDVGVMEWPLKEGGSPNIAQLLPFTHREVPSLHRHFSFAGLLHCLHSRGTLRKVKKAVVAELVGVIRCVQYSDLGQLWNKGRGSCSAELPKFFQSTSQLPRKQVGKKHETTPT